MPDPVIPPIEEPKPFDYAAHKAAANAADEAKRTGKTLPFVAPAEVKPPEPKDDTIPLPKSVRRTMSELRDRAARAEGALEAIEKYGLRKPDEPAAPAKSTVDDPEPQPHQFAKLANGQPNPDAEKDYNRALGRWDARQEAKKEVGKVTEQTAQSQEEEELMATFRAIDEKFEQDRKSIPDYDQVAAELDPEAMFIDRAKQPVFYGLIGTSPVRAHVLYHFAKHPEDFDRIRDLADPEKIPQRHNYKSEETFNSALGKWSGAQVDAFRRLEGVAEYLYKKSADKPKEEKPKPSAVERDAALAPPTSSVAPRGGAPTNGDIPMLLSDGKTLNPAWKAARNMREGRKP